MQCSRMVSFARATYNRCLRTEWTDCNFVCSLEQESHTTPFMLSIHSPDNVFMVLVSIFISNHNHFCVITFGSLLPAAARNTVFMTYWNIELNTLKTYVRTIVQRCLYVSALWCRDKNSASSRYTNCINWEYKRQEGLGGMPKCIEDFTKTSFLWLYLVVKLIIPGDNWEYGWDLLPTTVTPHNCLYLLQVFRRELHKVGFTRSCIKPPLFHGTPLMAEDLADIFSDTKLWQVNKTNLKLQALPLHIHPCWTTLGIRNQIPSLSCSNSVKFLSGQSRWQCTLQQCWCKERSELQWEALATR